MGENWKRILMAGSILGTGGESGDQTDRPKQEEGIRAEATAQPALDLSTGKDVKIAQASVKPSEMPPRELPSENDPSKQVEKLEKQMLLETLHTVFPDIAEIIPGETLLATESKLGRGGFFLQKDEVSYSYSIGEKEMKYDNDGSILGEHNEYLLKIGREDDETYTIESSTDVYPKSSVANVEKGDLKDALEEYSTFALYQNKLGSSDATRANSWRSIDPTDTEALAEVESYLLEMIDLSRMLAMREWTFLTATESTETLGTQVDLREFFGKELQRHLSILPDVRHMLDTGERPR